MRRVRLWRQGRPAAVDFWGGLAAVPRRYLVDLHHVVARDRTMANTHVAAAGGFVAALVLGLAVHLQRLFHDRARQLVLGRAGPVRQPRDDAGQLAVAVGLGELLGQAFLGQAVMALGRAVAQHQVREVDVELVRRHIGTRHHEAHVAERAAVDHLLEILGVDGVELHGLGLVDQVEEGREGIAEIEAAAAAVTDVEDPAQLLVELLEVIEVGVLPVDRVADRRIQAAFGHGGVSRC
ncbi:MAG: DUF3483 domain-containing protein [Rhodovibrionaceae bacterium]|nr:DUF3483 domain-containing protein [Rhodovibrionaceae bacterium]